MSEVSSPAANLGETDSKLGATCYRCIHLRYRGSQSLRNLTNAGTVIPMYEGEGLDPGRYSCGKLEESIGPADQTPEPLEEGASCKEVR